MASVVRMNPTSPGRRGVVKVVETSLYGGRPFSDLVFPKKRTGGRSSSGRISVRHKGGGSKVNYRLIDFRRDKDGIPAKVERLEYDPNRSSFIALVCYADGERRYVIATEGVESGAVLFNGSESPIKPGNCLPITSIPVGSVVHCIELKPGKGGQLARSAGCSAVLLAKEGDYAQVRLKSGEVRRVHVSCRATLGEVSNPSHSLKRLGKAGATRWRGVRPTVRGVAMNPIDHPHGGGEGRTGEGRHPVSPWGKLTKGYRTRRNKRTASMIVQKRYS
jgi:large subunit ribosomal protein L2